MPIQFFSRFKCFMEAYSVVWFLGNSGNWQFSNCSHSRSQSTTIVPHIFCPRLPDKFLLIWKEKQSDKIIKRSNKFLENLKVLLYINPNSYINTPVIINPHFLFWTLPSRCLRLMEQKIDAEVDYCYLDEDVFSPSNL